NPPTYPPTNTPTRTPPNPPTCTPTPTPTNTPTFTPTNTPTFTPTPIPILVSHVFWQGRPFQPNPLQQLPITLTLKAGTTEVNYPAQTTDTRGFFTFTVGGMSGIYTWRVKGPSRFHRRQRRGHFRLQRAEEQLRLGWCTTHPPGRAIAVLDALQGVYYELLPLVSLPASWQGGMRCDGYSAWRC